MASAQTLEIEVKSLLGSSERAEEIRQKIKAIDPKSKLLSRNKQLNHYFINGDLQKLAKNSAKVLNPNAANRLLGIVNKAKDASVRTRDKDGEVLLVVKASVDDTSSENGIARLEFEEQTNMSLEELDSLVQESGYEYQAKWSREREEYVVSGINVTLDKNAGYGWLAEFEKIVTSESDIPAAKAAIAELMEALGAQELPQDRLGRMFAHYNEHWAEYYGTEKTFTIE